MRPKVVRLQVGSLQTNCYLLSDNGEIAIIDPGFESDRILAEVGHLLQTSGQSRDLAGVRYIINTHAHVDHIGENTAIKRATKARILIGRKDAAHLTDAVGNLSQFFGGVVLSPKADQLLDEGDTVRVGTESLKVVETPGHTEGGICLIGDGLAFTGDTLFLDSIGRTDLPGGSVRQMKESLARLVSLLPDDFMIYPGHNEPGLMGEAKSINPFLDFSCW